MKEVKTTTTYTSDRLKKFLEIYFFDKFKVIRITMNILAGILIIYFFRKYKLETTDILSFIFAVLCIIELNTTMIPRINFLRISKKKTSIIDSKMKYQFNKINFCIIKDKNEYISYAQLYKVIETINDYYLYINKSKVYIVGKEDLDDKEMNFITDNIREKVSTYIIKNV